MANPPATVASNQRRQKEMPVAESPQIAGIHRRPTGAIINGAAKGQIMSSHSNHNYPKLHNAMWPGLVGKGSPGAEPCIDLDTMLDLTARASVGGVKFDGVDIFLYEPHLRIDIDEEGIQRKMSTPSNL